MQFFASKQEKALKADEYLLQVPFVTEQFIRRLQPSTELGSDAAALSSTAEGSANRCSGNLVDCEYLARRGFSAHKLHHYSVPKKKKGSGSGSAYIISY